MGTRGLGRSGPGAYAAGMGRGTRSAVLCMVTCTGCDGGVVDAILTLPPPGAARTVLVGAEERAGARVYLGDLEAEAGLVLPLGARRADAGPVALAYFAPALAPLGLSPGWQQEAGPGVEASPVAEGADALLGAPEAVFEADLGAEPPRWVAADRLAPALAAFRVAAAPSRCAAFEAARFSLQVPMAVRWAVPLGADAALLAGTEGRFGRVGADGAFAFVIPPDPLESGVAKDGALYLGTADGRVLRAAPDPVDLVAEVTPLGASLPAAVVAVAAGAADDVFALLGTGALHHFDGQAWREWGAATDLAGGLEWIGPQEALLTSSRPELVHRAVEGRLRAEAVEGVGILALGHVAGLGTLGGTSDGELVLRDAGGWRSLGSPRFGWWAVDILPRPAGALYMLASGSVAGYTTSGGFCPDLFSGRILSSGVLLPMGQDVLHVARLPDQDVSELTWLPGL